VFIHVESFEKIHDFHERLDVSVHVGSFENDEKCP
jgi:hypothetical protein